MLGNLRLRRRTRPVRQFQEWSDNGSGSFAPFPLTLTLSLRRGNSAHHRSESHDFKPPAKPEVSDSPHNTPTLRRLSLTGNLGNERAKSIVFSCERMAGFGVKKSCVHQNPLIFFPVTGSRYVLFQSSVFAVQPEFWAATSGLQASTPFDSSRHLIDPPSSYRPGLTPTSLGHFSVRADDPHVRERLRTLPRTKENVKSLKTRGLQA